MDDSPGFKAGVRAGDRIVKIDGKTTEKMSVADAVKKLRGEPGTDVTISVVRPPATAAKDYKLTRAVIKVDTVKDINGRREFPLSENKVGYVRLSQFGEHTADDLERALKILEERGAQSLIMDLRDNPGGLLDQAVKVCDKFLPRGQLIVSTEGRNAAEKSVFNATGRTKHPNLPMVLLINGGSASASEIVAGCLQDLKRAYVMGEKSFGKGSVQSILPLPDGAALRLTTAKYYTPSHKVIHEHGIEPDSVVPMSLEEERDLMLKRAPGGVESLEGKDRERVQKARDTQLERAMDYLKGVSILLSQLKPETGKVAAK
jgi:carboxyl-terminal processing protease